MDAVFVGARKITKQILWFSTIFLVALILSKVEVVEANPVGGVVSAGNASITSSGNLTQINQSSDKAIINWNSFNIAANETTQFIQPSAQAVALNRIDATQGASNILGKLNANGQVFLVNPAGIMFGAGSQVDVAGLLATTANITDSDFLSGHYHFTGGQNSVINEGMINIADGGFVALVAPTVINSGVIRANLGKVALGAGSDFTLDFYGDNLINFDIGSAGNSVTNSGKIIANGGTVLLTAQTAQGVVNNVINMSGVIQANSVRQQNGEIILSGGSSGVVNVTGKLIASGHHHGQTGGTIKILGNEVGLFGNAQVIATGSAGGGVIDIGGDFHGAGPDQNASYTYVAPNVTIDASALLNGNGGNIAVWSNLGTQFYGTILAKGGSQSGNGGFVETSGDYLYATGFVNTSAPAGLLGTWLLDPTENVTITTATASDSPSGSNPITWTPTATSSTILNTTIDTELAGGSNVLVVTGSSGDITVSSSIIDFNGVGTPTLTLQAAGNIFINSGAGIGVSGSTGALNIVLTANQGGAGGAVNIGDGVTLSTLNSHGGNITISGTGTSTTYDGANAGVDLNDATLTAAGGIISITGTGAANAPSQAYGINLNGSVTLSTNGSGQINLTGYGGTNGPGIDSGIRVVGATIAGTGNATVTLTGSGGTSSSGLNELELGLQLFSGSISTVNGALTLKGIGGTSGGGINEGIQISSGITTSATGSGNMILTGVGGSGGSTGIVLGASSDLFTSNMITLTADSMSFDSTSQIGGTAANTGYARNVILQPYSNSTTIGIAATTGGLDLTATELNTIRATGIRMGNSASGNITIGAWTPSSTFISSGTLTLNTAGTITQGSGDIISAYKLITTSGAGTTLTENNAVQNFNATDRSSTGINLTNTDPLLISGISETGTGNILINNTGNITDSGLVRASGGSITLNALTGTETINSIIRASGSGTVNLETTGTNDLTINALVSSASGAISLSAGQNLILNSRLQATSGTVTIAAAGNVTLNGGSILGGTGVNIGTSGTHIGGNITLENSANITNASSNNLAVYVTGNLSLSGNSSIQALAGSITVDATSGNIVLASGANMNAGSGNITLTSDAGYISESDTSAFINTIGTLSTSSVTGTSLMGNNVVSIFTATNSTSGDISLASLATTFTLGNVTQAGTTGNIYIIDQIAYPFTQQGGTAVAITNGANTTGTITLDPDVLITNGRIYTQGGNITLLAPNTAALQQDLFVNGQLSTGTGSGGALIVHGGVSVNASSIHLGAGNIILEGNGLGTVNIVTDPTPAPVVPVIATPITPISGGTLTLNNTVSTTLRPDVEVNNLPLNANIILNMPVYMGDNAHDTHGLDLSVNLDGTVPQGVIPHKIAHK